MSDPASRRCGHCGRTSHGFVCCGLLAADYGEVCTIDHTRDRTDHAEEAHPPRHLPGNQHGPTPPRRPARRIDPRGNR